jgi:penicillin-binding protein 1A
MNATFDRLRAATVHNLRRAGAAVRRHPWLTALALPVAAALYVLALIPFTPSIGDLRKVKQEQPTVVLSADGKELAVFKRANRDWVKLKDISPHVTAALIATEDHRFYRHHGLDWRRTARAIVHTAAGDRQGGSTLTQQLARNLYPEQIGRAPTITRKLKEAITALKIEAVYSKDEILETYLNSVSFLYNAWGIEMAARTYFDKPASQLTVLEAATLVGMLKGTSQYNPVLNPERAKERRNIVLAQMVRHERITQAQMDQLARQPINLDFERQPEVAGPAPHLTQQLRRWLLEWADRRDYDIYADGLVVRTTIDSRLQQMANEAVKRQGDALQAVAEAEWARSATPAFSTNPEAYARQRGAGGFAHFWNTHVDLHTEMLRESAPYREARAAGLGDQAALDKVQSDAQLVKALREEKTRLQAGFVAMEPNSGHVLAWVGSRDFEHDKFDHVQQARRQPGSTFKPFVYGAAFEQGVSPEEMLPDVPVEIRIDARKVWRPTDVGTPSGLPTTLRDGLIHSKNTITAQLVQRIGPGRVAALARSMGVRQSKLDEVPSLALGTSPVTLKEMVSSFGTIANGGSYIEPIVVTRVEDRSGNILEAFLTKPPEPALANMAAQTLVDVLRGVVTQGTAAGLRGRFALGDLDLAGKTGTSQEHADGWFILMHPNLVAGSWVGFNDNRVTLRSDYWGQGAHNALLVVGDFFEQALKAGRVDRKARFVTPPPPQPQPLLDRMNDWWNSVFTGSPAEVAAVPDPASVPMPPLPMPAPIAQPEPPAMQPVPPAWPADTARVPEWRVNPAETARVPEWRVNPAEIAPPAAPQAQVGPAPASPAAMQASPPAVVTAPVPPRPVEAAPRAAELPANRTITVRRPEVTRTPSPAAPAAPAETLARPRMIVIPADEPARPAPVEIAPSERRAPVAGESTTSTLGSGGSVPPTASGSANAPPGASGATVAPAPASSTD